MKLYRSKTTISFLWWQFSTGFPNCQCILAGRVLYLTGKKAVRDWKWLSPPLMHPPIRYSFYYHSIPKCATGAPCNPGHQNDQKRVWHTPNTFDREDFNRQSLKRQSHFCMPTWRNWIQKVKETKTSKITWIILHDSTTENVSSCFLTFFHCYYSVVTDMNTSRESLILRNMFPGHAIIRTMSSLVKYFGYGTNNCKTDDILISCTLLSCLYTELRCVCI